MKALEMLKRKYGSSLEEVLENYVKFKLERDDLRAQLESIKTIDQDMQNISTKLGELDAAIKKVRIEVSNMISDRVMFELKDLKMDKVWFSYKEKILNDFSLHGKHLMEFTASMNPGQDFLPIAKIASGGELSRIFLALELSLKDNLNVDSIVFDEIDSGVGARLGSLIGNKILSLSKNNIQSFVITHLPQPAAIAEKHFKVGKMQTSDETISYIEEISDEKRKLEITEMMGEIPI